MASHKTFLTVLSLLLLCLAPACSKGDDDGGGVVDDDPDAARPGDVVDASHPAPDGGGPPRPDGGTPGGLTDAGPAPDGGAPGPVAHLVGAGDIAECDVDEEATAKLLDTLPGTIFVAGDNAYDEGTLAEYQQCFHPTWGRHKARIRPTPGNHEYESSGTASGYFTYFGAAAGPAGKGYYSYDLGTWHIVVLNSNDKCEFVACDEGSAQWQWLKADLAAHPGACTLAYVHHPRFSSGDHGDQAFMADLWRVMRDAGVDVVLSGHDHHYERFAPMDADGTLDPGGIRQFVVGTGGRGLYDVDDAPRPGREALNNDTHGVLSLTLRPGRYDWTFVPVAGGTFSDSGSAACH